jgi:hypothetical protein
VLFSVGAACFALGALPGYLALVGATADGLTFFVGSIFFTTAAFLQYLEVIAPRRILAFAPRRADWWAVVVQLAGTLFFNVSTFRALSDTLGDSSYDRLVWMPDVYGCICFLVASGVAFAVVGPHPWSWRPQPREWRIAALNLGGSIAFAASGIAAHVVPGTDTVRNSTLVNLGTFVGAVGFLVGALELVASSKAPSGRVAA